MSPRQLPSHPTADDDDLLVANAMDRVLEAERAARVQIEHCEGEMHQRLDAAREQRRLLLERARARIVALQARVSRSIERQDAQLHAQGAAGAAAVEEIDQARLNSVLATLAGKLTAAE